MRISITVESIISFKNALRIQIYSINLILITDVWLVRSSLFTMPRSAIYTN